MNRETIFSPDRVYRYTLWREWGVKFEGKTQPLFEPLKPSLNDYVQFIGLNPSTADETKDDPTVRRCIDFAKQWGFGAMCMTNLFAFRATDPKAMKVRSFPEGEGNIEWLCKIGANAGLIVVAWGSHGAHYHRDQMVLNILRGNNLKLHCLGRNQDGTPKHPLYLPKTTQPILL